MTRINLLPVKAARRLELARREITYAAGALGALLFLLATWFSTVEIHLSDLKAKVASAQSSITALAGQASQIDKVKQDSSTLEQKLLGVETLKKSRSGPAKMMAEVADIFTAHPEVWLTRFSDFDGHLTLEGGAVDQEHVSALQLALSHDSKFFSDVTLGIVNAVHEAGVEYVSWTITCNLHYDAS